ncbi:MAG: helix-turn-helix domain-containing protein [Lachnospiraceae bacterium]|nr:helix-turn-helix domain-containing protein [Lachnospiraceae bacterium]
MEKMSIAAWRRAKGLSQGTVADRCGVSRVTLHKWEARPSMIPAGKLFVLLDAIGVPISAVDFREGQQ